MRTAQQAAVHAQHAQQCTSEAQSRIDEMRRQLNFARTANERLAALTRVQARIAEIEQQLKK